MIEEIDTIIVMVVETITKIIAEIIFTPIFPPGEEEGVGGLGTKGGTLIVITTGATLKTTIIGGGEEAEGGSVEADLHQGDSEGEEGDEITTTGMALEDVGVVDDLVWITVRRLKEGA